MAHGHALVIDVEEVKEAGPIQPSSSLRTLFFVFLGIGGLTMVLGLLLADPKHFWSAYYTSMLFWMGLAAGGVMVTAIFQIVRAKWAASVRRFAEANVAFLPWAYIAFLFSFFGKDILFPWGNPETPMPGREAWMEPHFVYGRFAVLLAVLFFFMWRFVRLSIRSDLGVLQSEDTEKKRWFAGFHNSITEGWKGETEVLDIQRRLSFLAPALVAVYVVVYSLFAFEMVMGMDTIWYSNMFGGFLFVGNLYLGWTTLAMLTTYFSRKEAACSRAVSANQLWDIGKLMFGFCMLWGYLFFSQYLPQWYGNLPEETQWLILRTRGLWQPLSYTVFGMCFVVPFILLLSEDLKKNATTLCMVGIIILLGNWLMYYVLVTPQLFPERIPLAEGGLMELGIFLGFLGGYGLAIQQFMSRVPFAPVSHPMTHGSIEW